MTRICGFEISSSLVPSRNMRYRCARPGRGPDKCKIFKWYHFNSWVSPAAGQRNKNNLWLPILFPAGSHVAFIIKIGRPHPSSLHSSLHTCPCLSPDLPVIMMSSCRWGSKSLLTVMGLSNIRQFCKKYASDLFKSLHETFSIYLTHWLTGGCAGEVKLMLVL